MELKHLHLTQKDELIKIIETTNYAKDLELFVRVSVSNEHAEIDLSKKFGVITSEATGLLRLTKQYSKKLELVFMLALNVCIRFLIQKVLRK